MEVFCEVLRGRNLPSFFIGSGPKSVNQSVTDSVFLVGPFTHVTDGRSINNRISSIYDPSTYAFSYARVVSVGFQYSDRSPSIMVAAIYVSN